MAESRAKAEEFSDLWGELIHSGRWYRSLTVFLAVVVLVLLVVVMVQASRPAPMPLVVRVDEVGRAEVVDYEVERSSLDQNDPVVGYFLNSFVRDHFERRHALRAERWQRSLAFMTVELQQQVYAETVEELTVFVSTPDAPEFLVENVVVRVVPQPEPPYRAEVIFDRVEQFGPTEIARERMTLSLQFVFADSVPAAALLVNPLGLVITFMDVQRQLVGVDGLG
ncbi:MAG: VirB8/TrbF family protein [Acidobacteria bacterium]|nr:VirB8/TrbF family protein [Acidobacteriota bacterium]